MNTNWGGIIRLGILVVLLVVGCRSTQPDLKPAKQPEQFNPPPDNVNLTNYPKQAWRSEDDQSNRPANDPNGMGQGSRGMPAANFGGPSGGGLR